MRLVLSAAVAALLCLGCEEKVKPSVLSDVVTDKFPSQESWNSTITFSDSGIVRAIVSANHIYSYDNSSVTHLEHNVVVDFFNSEGEHTTKLTSEKASVDEKTNNLEAVGNVVVTSDSGTVVRSDRMYWDNARQLIHSPDFVTITSPTQELQGTGFESDHNLTNYRIFKVTGKAESK